MCFSLHTFEALDRTPYLNTIIIVTTHHQVKMWIESFIRFRLPFTPPSVGENHLHRFILPVHLYSILLHSSVHIRNLLSTPPGDCGETVMMWAQLCGTGALHLPPISTYQENAHLKVKLISIRTCVCLYACRKIRHIEELGWENISCGNDNMAHTRAYPIGKLEMMENLPRRNIYNFRNCYCLLNSFSRQRHDDYGMRSNRASGWAANTHGTF